MPADESNSPERLTPDSVAKALHRLRPDNLDPDRVATRNAARNEARRRELERRRNTKDACALCRPLELKFAKIMAAEPALSHTVAIERAGYKPRKHKNGRWSSGWMGSMMFKRPIVRAAIYQLMSESLDASKIETAAILRETAALALTPDHMIEGKITYREKIEALKLLGSFFNLLNATVTHKHELTFVRLLVDSARAEQSQLTHDTARVINGTAAPDRETERVAAGGADPDRASEDPPLET